MPQKFARNPVFGHAGDERHHKYKYSIKDVEISAVMVYHIASKKNAVME